MQILQTLPFKEWICLTSKYLAKWGTGTFLSPGNDQSMPALGLAGQKSSLYMLALCHGTNRTQRQPKSRSFSLRRPTSRGWLSLIHHLLRSVSWRSQCKVLCKFIEKSEFTRQSTFLSICSCIVDIQHLQYSI
jgi:hypothetical protein